jgi:uncharacterized protein (TIGR03437 family)
MRRFFWFVALTAFVPAAFGQPKIFLTPIGVSKIQNNYSYILPGMPNHGIAQGSIFDIFGVGLATATSALQRVPLPTVLNGTSVNVTVNGTTTHAILYFVSDGQIAAILPSATPVGTGQITVTVNGQASTPGTITVVQSAFGLLSYNGAGNGPAAVFDVNSQFLGLTNAANPGDFITLWGSGLGPVMGDETIAQVPADLTNIPIEVDIGGKVAQVQYHGRSVYPGLDQINVQVPSGVSGCHVSVVVRSGDIVSNFGTIPVALSGRICSEPVVGLTAIQIQNLLFKPVINRGYIDFLTTSADVLFERYTNAQYAVKQPLGAGGVSLGDCTVFNYRNVNMGLGNPIQGVPLDAGPAISLTTPNGNASLPFQDGAYSIAGLPPGSSAKGSYTFTGSGGADIGTFSAQVTFIGGGSSFSWSAPNKATSVIRSQGLTLTWTQPGNSDPAESIQINGFAFVPNAPFGAEFVCNVSLAAGRFTIPPAVLLALPSQAGLPMPQAQLEVDLVIYKSFTAPGSDQGTMVWVFGNPQPFSYQ